jgi:hypothetical protein
MVAENKQPRARVPFDQAIGLGAQVCL